MSELIIKHFSEPDDRRSFVGHGHADILDIDGSPVGMAVLEPGWRWSQDVAPLEGTKSCGAEHRCYVASGRLIVKMDDGSQGELKAGDFAVIPPGHDAWVVGDQACVLVDFTGMTGYAQRKAAREAEQTSQPLH